MILSFLRAQGAPEESICDEWTPAYAGVTRPDCKVGQQYHYMTEWYIKNWQQEVDFLVAELGLAPGSRVLDVGCGTGRHAVELYCGWIEN